MANKSNYTKKEIVKSKAKSIVKPKTSVSQAKTATLTKNVSKEKPIEKKATVAIRIQTAEGWKRAQLKNRK